MPEKVAGWKHFYSGKVRDLYESEDSSKADLVLIVASDRISAFDNILSPAIPGKGENLTAITNFWFEKLNVPNHRVQSVAAPSEVAGRATVAKKLEMYPVECVVRGYIAGSGYKEYLATGEICGIKLPTGLKDGDKLAEPIFTPAFKAEVGEHDQNIDFEKVVELVGNDVAQKLRSTSIEIFNQANAIALKAGLVLADTKFEFGRDPRGEEIVLADEVLTPDSSRYWDKTAYEQGSTVESFDKQIVRNWLLQSWDPEGSNPPTVLSPELVEKVSSRYAELRQKLADANQ
jgi:phosphoribosylaminoimidazole-succinocarboxamide synthase